jgi:hypothetical protein
MIEVIPATVRHIKELSMNIREKDGIEALNAGIDPIRGVFFSWRSSIYRWAYLLDGEVLACSGIAGSPLGQTGQPWLVTSERISFISPLKFAKIYIRESQKMKGLFPVLENYVDASYRGAVRMLSLAGFSLEPVLINNHDFYRFRMVS